jgi:hypothetical protein
MRDRELESALCAWDDSRKHLKRGFMSLLPTGLGRRVNQVLIFPRRNAKLRTSPAWSVTTRSDARC